MLKDLCNDTRHEVRAAACGELPKLFKYLDSPNEYLHELAKFISDESLFVKAACLQALVEVTSDIDDGMYI